MAWKPLAVTVCFLGVGALNISKQVFPCGSLPYWLLTVAIIPWVLAFFFAFRCGRLYALSLTKNGSCEPEALVGVRDRSMVLKWYAKRVAAGYPFVEGDVRWDPTNSIKYPVLCIAAGLAAGESPLSLAI
jgi:hypothetical protein